MRTLDLGTNWNFELTQVSSSGCQSKGIGKVYKNEFLKKKKQKQKTFAD
jgi:hypothetical protein